MKVNQLKAGVILSYTGMAVSNLISLLYTPLMLRLLGKSEYGLYQLVFSAVSYLGLLNFGFNNAYLRFYSRYRVRGEEAGIRSLNGMFLAAFSLMSLVAFVCGIFLSFHCDILFAQGADPDQLASARILCILMTVNLALVFPNGLFEAYASAHEQYIFQRILSLSQSILNPLLTLPLLLAGYRSVSLILAQTLVTIIRLTVNVGYCRRRLGMRFSFRGMEGRVMGEILGFSSYIFLNMLTDQINWNVGKLILGKTHGTAGVAVFAVASQLNQYYINLSTAVSSVFLPRVNRITARGGAEMREQLNHLFCAVGRIQFLILFYILGGFLILGRYFISVWAGPGYEEAYATVLLLICPVLIPLIQNLGIEIQRAQDRHRFRSLLYTLIALGNLLVSIPLTIAFGVKGAAMGTCASLLIGNGLIMNLYNHRKMGLDMIRFWREILGLLLPGAGAAGAGLLLGSWLQINSLPRFLAAGAAYTLVYGLLEWNFGMKEKEKRLVLDPAAKAAGACKALAARLGGRRLKGEENL